MIDRLYELLDKGVTFNKVLIIITAEYDLSSIIVEAIKDDRLNIMENLK